MGIIPLFMREPPRRPRRLAGGRILLPKGDTLHEAGAEDWPFGMPDHHHRLIRRARAVRRALLVLLWTLPAMPVQTFLLALPNRAHVAFARYYWVGVARLLGLSVRLIGQPANSGRPVVFISNHSSWLDVPALGGALKASFVAKSEISTWPLVSTVARLGRTVFVSRVRGHTISERDSMRGRLRAGDSLILFPEGTTSDGSRVMQFRSTFFAIAEGEDPPLIQPVSVVYDRVAGLPARRACRPLFAWYGDMDLASHYWRLAQHRGLRATVLLHAPLDPTRYPDRKALARAVWQRVADGAATLRQNRPVQPLPSPGDAPGARCTRAPRPVPDRAVSG
jgi:1-acyl-sn-glycerol-3-phosphate acyltransferase